MLLLRIGSHKGLLTHNKTCNLCKSIILGLKTLLVLRCRAIFHLDKSLETRVKESEREELVIALLVGLSKQPFGRERTFSERTFQKLIYNFSLTIIFQVLIVSYFYRFFFSLLWSPPPSHCLKCRNKYMQPLTGLNPNPLVSSEEMPSFQNDLLRGTNNIKIISGYLHFQKACKLIPHNL